MVTVQDFLDKINILLDGKNPSTYILKFPSAKDELPDMVVKVTSVGAVLERVLEISPAQKYTRGNDR